MNCFNQRKSKAPAGSQQKRKGGALRITPEMHAALSRIVQRQVQSQEEVKVVVGVDTQTIGGYNYSGFASNQIRAISPYQTRLPIAQGTAQGNRIGNRINIKRSRLQITLVPAPYDISTNPTPQPSLVLWFIFSKKNNGSELSSLPGFFQTGSSSVNPSSTMLDSLYPVNSDVYTVHRRGQALIGFSSNDGTGKDVAYQSWTSNDCEILHKIDIDYTHFMKKTVVYDDSTNTPTSDVLMLALYTVSLNNVDSASTTVAPVLYNVLQEVTYTDA